MFFPAPNSKATEELRTHVILEAMTLPERIAILHRFPKALSPSAVRSIQRLAKWKHVLGIPPSESIHKRFNTLGITAEEVDTVLGDFNSAAIGQVTIPEWWIVCERVLTRARTLDAGELPAIEFFSGAITSTDHLDRKVETASDEEFPFGHALATWVAVATDMLRGRLPEIERILSPGVLYAEQRGLLRNLCTLARSCLFQRFQLQKLATYNTNDLVVGLSTKPPPRVAYIATIHALLNDGFADLMRSRPALARLLATRVEYWVRTLAEFVEHLDTDRRDLERVFNDGRPLGVLVKAIRGISDSHNGGRAVMACHFECGTRVVYKPRSMSIDAAWNGIVEAFNAHIEADLRLKPVTVLDRTSHGWMEFVDRRSCKSVEEVRAFYRRVGSLLALVHALQGNDFHLENVVAAGSHPVAIDLETISTPETAADTKGIGPDPAVVLAMRSVLRTLLLPSVMARRGRNGLRNLGAIGVEVDVGAGKRSHQKLINVNTDFPRWVSVPGGDQRLDSVEQSKVELADGRSVVPKAYCSEVCAGCRAAYLSILDHRSMWLADGGPLSRLQGVWGRVLLRATNVYYRLLLETCNDDVLRSGVDRWIHGDRLMVNTEAETEVDEAVMAMGSTLVACEQAALLRGDIAYFVALGDDVEYYSPDPHSNIPARIPGTRLTRSAVEAARRQIAAMCEEDLTLQICLMDSSYLSSQVSADLMFHGSSNEVSSDQVETRPMLDKCKLDAWIIRGLGQLDTLAIRREGRTNWIAPIPNPQTETIQPSAMGMDLYGGLGGMALLFERAYRYFRDLRWLELARESIDAAYQQTSVAYQHGRFAGFDLEGPSGMLCRPGLIAATWAIGRHEGHGVYRELARRLLIDLTDRVIERDTTCDVVGGSAGYLLLALHLEREEAILGIEPILGALSDHIARRVTNVDGIGWRVGPNRRPLNGFGHGRAGTGLALLEVGTRLNRRDLRELGISALGAEHKMRSIGVDHSWPDLRFVETGSPIPTGPQINAWCAGAEGIALSRAAAMTYADHAFLADDLEYAVECMRTQPVGNRSHLCCGRAGRAEVWRTLGRLMHKPELIAQAKGVLSMAVNAHETDPTSPNTGTIGLSLMQGAAGRIWAALSEVMDDDKAALLLLRV